MSIIKLPEIVAREILEEYEGFNNHILDLKYKFEKNKKYKITRNQADYVIKYKDIKPKVARKFITIVSGFGESIKKLRNLEEIPNQVWCEKLLCESDEAYHIYGKRVTTDDKFELFWVPKAAIIVPERTLDRVIDFDVYNHRPLMQHQKVAVEKLICNDRFILADTPGTGKTTSAVVASIESGAKKILIVCPSTLKINWKREIEHYSDKRVFIVEGKKWGSTFDYYIINYDIIKNYHSTDDDRAEYNRLVNEKFDLAIIDEAHYLSNPNASRTKLLNDVLDKIPKVWLLTGTPMTSRPINYFNLLKIIRSPLTLNWQTYVRRYCKGFQFTVKGRKIWSVSGATNLDELRESTKNVILRRRKEDVLDDLPEKTLSPIYLELNSKMYDEELDEFIKISEENKDKDTLTVTLNRLMKVRQIIALEKIPYTCELIDKCIEQGGKVVVFTNFSSSLDLLHEKYKKISVVLDGRMSSTKKQESVDRFQTDDKIKVFIGNIKAAGVGITLTAAETVINNDLSFVPADHEQGDDRCFRKGQKNNVLAYYPIFENTIEMNIYNMLQKKIDNIDQVMGQREYSDNFTKEILKEIL